MFLSDFMHAKSTQELLYTLFCSEMGLLSAAHPSIQMEAVRNSFSTLQKNIICKLREGTEHFELSLHAFQNDKATRVVLSYRSDAELFKALYKGIDLFPGVADATVLNLKVYPLVGGMVLGNEELKKNTAALLLSHSEQHGALVGKRIARALHAFGLQTLANNVLTPSMANPGP